MTGLTSRGGVVLGLGLSLGAAGLLLGLRDLTRVGVLLLALPLLARFLVSRRFSLSARRDVVPPTVPPGTPVGVTLGVTNTGRGRSPLLVAEEGVPYALGDRPRLLVSRLSPGEQCRVGYQVRSHVRGRHRLGPLTARVADPFGLATRDVVVDGTSSLLVLPRTVALQGLPAMRAGAGGEEEGSHRVMLHGESSVGVREYRDGDDLRRIHWPSTARTGTMMVRQEEQPGRRRALVLLDNQAASHVGSGGAGSLEWSVSAAASVAVHLLAHDWETLLATAGPTGAPLAPLISTDDALAALAVVTTTSGTDAAGLVDAAEEVAAAGGGALVGVLGPMSEDTVSRLGRAGHGVAFVVDPTVFEHGGDRPSRTAAALTRLGWRAVDVLPGARVADVWSGLVQGTAR